MPEADLLPCVPSAGTLQTIHWNVPVVFRHAGKTAEEVCALNQWFTVAWSLEGTCYGPTQMLIGYSTLQSPSGYNYPTKPTCLQLLDGTHLSTTTQWSPPGYNYYNYLMKPTWLQLLNEAHLATTFIDPSWTHKPGANYATLFASRNNIYSWPFLVHCTIPSLSFPSSFLRRIIICYNLDTIHHPTPTNHHHQTQLLCTGQALHR